MISSDIFDQTFQAGKGEVHVVGAMTMESRPGGRAAAAASTRTSPARPAVAARDVVKQFGGMRAVDGMSLSLARGELVGLIGPNGAGKTTMFNIIAGSLQPLSGRIEIDGVDVSREAPEQRLARGLGRTFQIPRPFASMTVLENVLTGAQRQLGEGILPNILRRGAVAAQERAAVEKARGILAFLTLSHLEHELAAVLSGGQRKLLELARILMADPTTILLDEPAAGVNPSLLEIIMERVLQLHARGTTILLIEHNMDMVARLCQRVVVMAQGRFLAEGSPQDVAQDDQVVAAYLGQRA